MCAQHIFCSYVYTLCVPQKSCDRRPQIKETTQKKSTIKSFLRCDSWPAADVPLSLRSADVSWTIKIDVYWQAEGYTLWEEKWMAVSLFCDIHFWIKVLRDADFAWSSLRGRSLEAGLAENFLGRKRRKLWKDEKIWQRWTDMEGIIWEGPCCMLALIFLPDFRDFSSSG